MVKQKSRSQTSSSLTSGRFLQACVERAKTLRTSKTTRTHACSLRYKTDDHNNILLVSNGKSTYTSVVILNFHPLLTKFPATRRHGWTQAAYSRFIPPSKPTWSLPSSRRHGRTRNQRREWWVQWVKARCILLHFSHMCLSIREAVSHRSCKSGSHYFKIIEFSWLDESNSARNNISCPRKS